MKRNERVGIVSVGLMGLLFAAGGCGESPPGMGGDTSPMGSAGISLAPMSRGWQQLSGHVAPAMTAAPKMYRMDLATPLTVTIGLRVNDPEALARAVDDVSTPASPTFRQYLTPGEFADQFGPSPA